MKFEFKPFDEYNTCTDAIGVIRLKYLEGTLDADKARELIGTCLWGAEPGSTYRELVSIQDAYNNNTMSEKQASKSVAELIESLCNSVYFTNSNQELEQKADNVSRSML